MKIHDFSNILLEYKDKPWEILNQFLIEQTNNYIEPSIYKSNLNKEKNIILEEWYTLSNTKNWNEFYIWSTQYRENFWDLAINKLNIKWHKKYSGHLLDVSHPDEVVWCKDGKLNIIESCLHKNDKTAFKFKKESNETIDILSYNQLYENIRKLSHGLKSILKPNEKVIFYSPFSIEIIELFMACIAIGAIPVLVSDSFSVEELNIRIKLTEAKFIVCNPQYIYNEKIIPLEEKIFSSSIENIIWIGEIPKINSSKNQINYTTCITNESSEPIPYHYASSNDTCILLFSSGTTSTPKVIPWTHLTPLKCATDAQLIQNINVNDTVCWATSMGWMMAPWLIFAGLINEASIALYQGSPTQIDFLNFTVNSKVTVLGLVPSIVNVWKEKNIEPPKNWIIRYFSSTGEASHPSTYYFLYHLNKMNAPILEYCGGTEIGGAYIASTTELPLMMSAFNTIAPSLTLEFGSPNDPNELYIIPPSIGLSQKLLNKNHKEVYYDSSFSNYKRKHGDGMQSITYNNHLFYRSIGRVDDTMNLGGIKISSLEIENCLSTHPFVKEIAAIGYVTNSFGAEQLVIYVVTKTIQTEVSKDILLKELQQILSKKLNPLFKIFAIEFINELPRTSSNKVMRRSLKELFIQFKSQ
jgi:acetyl-CoA synthetase